MLRSFFSHLSSIAMAAFFAVIIWGVATTEENPSREAFYFDALPIELRNSPQDLVVYRKSDDKVQIKLRAPQSSWDQLQATSFTVVADLKSGKPGLQQIPIQVKVADSRVNVTEIKPKEIGITLERLKTRTLDLRSDVLDSVPLGYSFRSPSTTPTQVTVNGPEILVDQVADVSADIYLRGAKSPVEREVPIQARDGQGNIVSGVAISPTIAVVKVLIEQRVGYKDVSIKTVLKGAPAAGYWVSNIVVNPSTATIVGSPDAMAKIAGFIETVPIDVSGATADVGKRATLSLPEGVSVLNNEGVTVQVSVTPLLGGQTIRQKITLLNSRRGLNAAISPDSVDVILSGPLPSLQNLAPDDIQVTVDVAGLTSGVYQLKPRVQVVPTALRAQNIVPDTVQVRITDSSTATPSPTINPTPTVAK
jgi:YbbR domain-containing protein